MWWEAWLRKVHATAHACSSSAPAESYRQTSLMHCTAQGQEVILDFDRVVLQHPAKGAPVKALVGVLNVASVGRQIRAWAEVMQSLPNLDHNVVVTAIILLSAVNANSQCKSG